MKCLVLLCLLAAQNTFAAEVKWSGSMGWIYSEKRENDSLDAKKNNVTTTAAGYYKDTSTYITKAHAIRANLLASAAWETMETGVGVRTNGSLANNDQLNMGGGFDRAIAVEQAWFRYLPTLGSLNTSITFGRQKPVFAFDSSSENFFDNDLRLDGFGWQFKYGNFGLNLGQFVLGGRSWNTAANTNDNSSISKTEATQEVASSKSRFFMMYGFQPNFQMSLTQDIQTMLAIGYYSWTIDSTSNQTSAGTNLTNNTTGSTTTIIPSAAFKVHNPRQWQFFNTWTLPYKLAFSAEYILANKANFDSTRVTGYSASLPIPEANNKAWSAGLTYGSIQKAHDWNASYYYGKKGLASVIGAYSGDAFLPDNMGHVFKANYALAKDFVIGTVWMWLKEEAKINANGTSATGLPYAGSNANQELKTSYFEFNAMLNF